MNYKTEPEKDKALRTALGDALINDLVKAIEKVEQGPMTTKNHYGEYMAILSPWVNALKEGKKSPEEINGLCSVMVFYGANKEGIKDAIKVLF